MFAFYWFHLLTEACVKRIADFELLRVVHDYTVINIIPVVNNT